MSANGLAQVHQPRPWKCTTRTTATYCPIHGDCTCTTHRSREHDPRCPLHGQETNHPYAIELVV